MGIQLAEAGESFHFPVHMRCIEKMSHKDWYKFEWGEGKGTRFILFFCKKALFSLLGQMWLPFDSDKLFKNSQLDELIEALHSLSFDDALLSDQVQKATHVWDKPWKAERCLFLVAWREQVFTAKLTPLNVHQSRLSCISVEKQFSTSKQTLFPKIPSAPPAHTPFSLAWIWSLIFPRLFFLLSLKCRTHS